MVETVELHSDDDEPEEEPSPPVQHRSERAAIRPTIGGSRKGTASPEMRGLAPVSLASMISSDEEDEDEGVPVAMPHRAAGRVQTAPIDTAEALPQPPSPAVERWDSDDEGADDEMGSGQGLVAPVSMDHNEADKAVGIETDVEEEERVIVGDGIVADANFAEDDWDDDDP